MTQRQIWLNLAGLLALIGRCSGWHGQSTGVRTVPALTRALKDEPPKACAVLASLGPVAKPAVPSLLDLLADDDDLVRDRAVDALAMIGLPAATMLPALTHAPEDRTPPLWALCRPPLLPSRRDAPVQAGDEPAPFLSVLLFVVAADALGLQCRTLAGLTPGRTGLMTGRDGW